MKSRTNSILRSLLWSLPFASLSSVLTFGCGSTDEAPPKEAARCFVADYDAELREAEPRTDGINHVDTPATIAKLQELQVTTYLYLIWHAESDWDDLAEFLPAAEGAGIDVWVYLVPPSECEPTCSLPFGLDYIQWAREIAALSLQHPNLKAWSIDDFDDNPVILNPSYVVQMQDEAHAKNPTLAFVPQVYYRSMTPEFVDRFAPIVDGIIMAYRDDPYRNTQRIESLPSQLDTAIQLFAPIKEPLYLMVFANGLSRTPISPRPDYVDAVIDSGLQAMSAGNIEGLITYALRKDGLPDPDAVNLSHEGRGNYTLAFPAGVETAPGARGEISQSALIDPAAAKHRLSFWYKDSLVDAADQGRATLQLLVDSDVVWQEDPALSVANEWVNVQVDIDAYVTGKGSAKISFGLVDENPADRLFVVVRIDDLVPTGLTLENPGFEEADGWTFEAGSPAALGALDLFDANRPINIFNVVKERYNGACSP